MGRMNLDDLRSQLPVTNEVAYFQTGTYGPTLASVLKEVADCMQYEASLGPARPSTRQLLVDKEEAARGSLAELLNVKPNELGLAMNTTRSLHRVLRNVDWKEGDEFLTTNIEHVSTVDASRALEKERGVTVRVVDADETDGAFLEALENGMTDKTRMLLISHVASPNGRIMPVREAAALAHENGIPVLVDAAQSIGQFPVDVPSLGCDYLIGSGPKWLLGPMGSGYVWVAPDHTEGFRPYFTPDLGAWSKPDTPIAKPTTRSRTELGTYNHALVIGLGEAARTMINVGQDVIRDHVSMLSQILREAMLGTPRVNILTPLEPGKSAGVTTLSFDGYTENDMHKLVRWLDTERNILVKAQWLTAPLRPDHIGMRISVAGFNTEEEVRHLASSIQDGVKLGK
ncbi:MAG: aminotransferase class V-fold PLP-dependent enzyme [SAR202 cluster bacterium]|nr:aminotransferase class V-fold PLP-dependent enzyme [SAR202 cluster bacterium]